MQASDQDRSATRVTIKEVARKAGVSIGTVSRVLNAFPDVDPALRLRVEAAMRELNYRPNSRAQSFGRDRSQIISFLLCNGEPLNPVHASILDSVERYCAEFGYSVLFSRWDYSPTTQPADLRLPLMLQSNGMVECVIATGINYQNFVEWLAQNEVDHVILANNLITDVPRPTVNQVRYDDYGGCYEAVNYLIELGHKDIYYIGDIALPWFRIRYDAYRQAMTDRGLEPRAQVAGIADDPFENGYSSVNLILEHELSVTAILAGSDELAYGAMEAMVQHGRSVPRDISIIGVEPLLERTKRPSLTSVCVDSAEVGRQLAKMAMTKLNKRVDMPEVLVPTRLAKRGTCRPFRPEAGMIL